MRTEFDVLTANSLPYYYDLWALRSQRLGIDYDCLGQTELAKRQRVPHPGSSNPDLIKCGVVPL